ncbi:alpha-glucuronidase [Aureococcus anophagefferens]|nr:alpha-glucuronidase [Aureococcus anophagefferens]
MAAIVMRFVGLLLLLTHAAVAEDLDELWLRSELVEDAKLRSSYVAQLSSIRVSGDAGGFALTVGDDGVELSAATASGALYGVFDLLSTVRRGEALRSKASRRRWTCGSGICGRPATRRGYAGDSLIWPMAMWRDPNVDDGPGKTMLYVAPATTATRTSAGRASSTARAPVKNLGTEACVGMSPLETVACGAADDVFWYNTTPESGHLPLPPLGERDYQNQQFTVRDAGAGASTLRSVSAGGQCLTLLNAYPPSPAAPKNVSFTARLDAMLRLLKSAGVNGIVLNDVNACYAHNAQILETDVLANVTRNLGPAFEKWGLTPYFSACYGSPTVLSNVTPAPSYGSSNYSDYGLGCDRTSSGTGYAEFYAPEVRDMFEDVDACPVKNLLWFHNVPWTRPMPTPANYTPATADATVPLYDYIRFQHYDAVAQVAELAKRWDALEGRVDDARFSGVKARFAQQVRDATAMCDTIMGQFDAWYHGGQIRGEFKSTKVGAPLGVLMRL